MRVTPKLTASWESNAKETGLREVGARKARRQDFSVGLLFSMISAATLKYCENKSSAARAVAATPVRALIIKQARLVTLGRCAFQAVFFPSQQKRTAYLHRVPQGPGWQGRRGFVVSGPLVSPFKLIHGVLCQNPRHTALSELQKPH